MSVVDVKVLPSKGLPGHLPGHHALWRGWRDDQFSTNINKRRRDMVVQFIANKSQQLPVCVSLVQLDRIRPYSAYPLMLNGSRKVGLVYREFFILFESNDLKPNIRDEAGETLYTREEIVKLVMN